MLMFKPGFLASARLVHQVLSVALKTSIHLLCQPPVGAVLARQTANGVASEPIKETVFTQAKNNHGALHSQATPACMWKAFTSIPKSADASRMLSQSSTTMTFNTFNSKIRNQEDDI